MAKPAPFPHTYTVKLEDRHLAAPPRAPRRILDTAEKHCIISNALRVAVTLQADIRPAASSAA